MFLFICNSSVLKKYLNQSLVQVDKNVWIGKMTTRELGRLKKIAEVHKILDQLHILRVANEDGQKYLNKKIDILFEE